MKEYTGYNDKNGTKIREGDLVRFFWDWEKGYSDSADGGYTEMIDTVRYEDGAWYIICPTIGDGAFIWRHNEHCEIIGSIHDEEKVES